MLRPRNSECSSRWLRRLTSSGVLPCLLSSLALLGLRPAWGVSTPLEQYVRSLESSYRGVRSLRARFTQTYVWGGRKRVESGTVHFARGGRMRWDYQNPIEKLFLSDGKKVLFYVPEQRQLTRSSVRSSEDYRVPFRLLLSRLNLRKIFSKIEFADEALNPQPGNRVLRAFPKRAQEEAYEKVLIEVTPAFDIHRLRIFYPDRSFMDFVFEHIERNAPFSPALFRFTPPPGTEVIEQP